MDNFKIPKKKKNSTPPPLELGKKTICETCSGLSELDKILFLSRKANLVKNCSKCSHKRPREEDQSSGEVQTPTKKSDLKITPTKMATADGGGSSESPALTNEEQEALLKDDDEKMVDTASATTAAVDGNNSGTTPMDAQNSGNNSNNVSGGAAASGVPPNPGEGSSGATNAAAAAAQTSKSSPYVLHLWGGIEDRVPISKQLFEAFEKDVQAKWFTLKPEDARKLRITKMVFKDGFGSIGSANNLTAMWVKALAADFKFKGTQCRAWALWERPATEVAYGFLTGSYWKEVENNRKELKKIIWMNGLSGDFRVIGWDPRNKYGTRFDIEPDNNLLKGLKELGELSFGNCVCSLHFYLRKQKSETQYMSKTVGNTGKTASGANKTSSAPEKSGN